VALEEVSQQVLVADPGGVKPDLDGLDTQKEPAAKVARSATAGPCPGGAGAGAAASGLVVCLDRLLKSMVILTGSD
jgi:hypothetical protein